MYCYVPGCPNGNSSAKKARTMVQIFFSAPEDESLFKKWRAAVPKSDHEFSRTDKICEQHFQKSEVILFIETKLPNGNVRRLPATEPKLKPGTIPSIFPSLKLLFPETDMNKKKSEGNLKQHTLESERTKVVKRKISALEEEKLQSSPRVRPRKNITETPTSVPGKRRKLTEASPDDRKLKSESETEEDVVAISDEDDDPSPPAKPMPCSIRLVPLETLMENKTSNQRSSKLAVPSPGNQRKRSGQDIGKGKEVNSAKKAKPILKNVDSPHSLPRVTRATPFVRRRNQRLVDISDDPVSKELRMLMKGSQKRGKKEENKKIDSICSQLEKIVNEISEVQDDEETSDNSSEKSTSSTLTFNGPDTQEKSITRKAEAEKEVNIKESCMEEKNDWPKNRHRIPEDILRLRDALTSDDEGKAGKLDKEDDSELDSESEVAKLNETEKLCEKLDQTKQRHDKSDSTIQGDNKLVCGAEEHKEMGKTGEDNEKQDSIAKLGDNVGHIPEQEELHQSGEQQSEKLISPEVQHKETDSDFKEENVDQTPEQGAELVQTAQVEKPKSEEDEKLVQNADCDQSDQTPKESESFDLIPKQGEKYIQSEEQNGKSDSVIEGEVHCEKPLQTTEEGEKLDVTAVIEAEQPVEEGEKLNQSAVESEKLKSASELATNKQESPEESEKPNQSLEQIGQLNETAHQGEMSDPTAAEGEGLRITSANANQSVQGNEKKDQSLLKTDQLDEIAGQGEMCQQALFEGEKQTRTEKEGEELDLTPEEGEKLVQQEENSEELNHLADQNRKMDQSAVKDENLDQTPEQITKLHQPVQQSSMKGETSAKMEEPLDILDDVCDQGLSTGENEPSHQTKGQDINLDDELDKSAEIINEEDGDNFQPSIEEKLENELNNKASKEVDPDILQREDKEKSDLMNYESEVDKAEQEDEEEESLTPTITEVMSLSEVLPEDDESPNKKREDNEVLEVSEESKEEENENVEEVLLQDDESPNVKVLEASAVPNEEENENVEDGRTSPDFHDDAPLKSTPEVVTNLISSDSDADPTWEPDADAVEVSDDNDTDPGSPHEDDKDEKENNSTETPKKKDPAQRKNKKKKVTTTASIVKPSDRSPVNLLNTETIQQILKQIKLPLTTPVTVKIASVAKNSDDSSGLRKILPRPHQKIRVIEAGKSDLSKPGRKSNKNSQLDDKSQRTAKYTGLRMFEGLGKIKKTFDFSTFLTDVEDELQFKKFCYLVKECLRIVRDSKNAKTNIGKLTIKVSHKSVCDLSDETTMETDISQNPRTESNDEMEVLECMTVDSNIEDHFGHKNPTEKEIV